MNKPYQIRIVDEAFNQGCDARIGGRSQRSNPFHYDDPCYQAWQRGWLHTDQHWGEDVEGRWNYPPLPAVIELRRNLQPSLN